MCKFTKLGQLDLLEYIVLCEREASMKVIEGKIYLSPNEASQMLRVSYKTIQRWAESGKITLWIGEPGSKKRRHKRIRIKFEQMPTGYRYYARDSLLRVKDIITNP